jgi:hypothetical protein
LGRWLSFVELGALLAVAIAALAFQLSLPGRLVQERDYQALADALRQEAKAGDVVLLFPWWTERARLFVSQVLPVVGYLESDRDPLRSFSRIWVLAQPRLPKSDLSKFLRTFGIDRVAVGSPRSFGNLELSLFRNDLFRPKFFDATASYAGAKVYLEQPDGARQQCPFDGKAHRCPGQMELHVAPEWHELHYRPERCLTMHPPGGRTRLVAEFSDFPLSNWIRLEGGMTWDRATFRGPSITPVVAGLEDEHGQELMRLEFPPGVDRAQNGERKAPSGLASPATVRLWVQSDSPELRDFCVNLFSEGLATADPQ